jgi:hypothetical protein
MLPGQCAPTGRPLSILGIGLPLADVRGDAKWIKWIYQRRLA